MKKVATRSLFYPDPVQVAQIARLIKRMSDADRLLFEKIIDPEVLKAVRQKLLANDL
jgi:hypothetical protein